MSSSMALEIGPLMAILSEDKPPRYFLLERPRPGFE